MHLSHLGGLLLSWSTGSKLKLSLEIRMKPWTHLKLSKCPTESIFNFITSATFLTRTIRKWRHRSKTVGCSRTIRPSASEHRTETRAEKSRSNFGPRWSRGSCLRWRSWASGGCRLPRRSGGQRRPRLSWKRAGPHECCFMMDTYPTNGSQIISAHFPTNHQP